VKDLAVLGFQFLFVFCIIYAMVSDYRKLKIPNFISIILIAAFFPFALIAGPAVALLPHLLVAGAVFVVLFASFAFGWLGGGDVKLASAVMLWAGPTHGVSFVLLFAVLGGVFALVLLSLRYMLSYNPGLESVAGLGRLSQWARNGLCPYALPIGLAALLVAPSIFGAV
jgi:prepilin peptidase CpaA